MYHNPEIPTKIIFNKECNFGAKGSVAYLAQNSILLQNNCFTNISPNLCFHGNIECVRKD